MKLYTTLNQIRSHSPCSDGWETLLKHLGKTKPDDEPLSFATILESNGFDDALWCLRTVDGYERVIRLYAVWCVRQVEHLDPSGVSKNINDVSERYANGEAMEAELVAARKAAWAARKAAREAREAAMAAMAAREAREAEGKAAWEAWEAEGKAWEAAMAAMAAREAREAEGKAAWEAWEAEGKAWEAAMAAREAAWEAQKQEFIKRFCTEEE